MGVGNAARHRAAVVGGEGEGRLAQLHRFGQPALGIPYVGEGDRGALDVGDVPLFAHAVPALGPEARGVVEVAFGPRHDPQEARGAGPGKMVTFRGKVQHPMSMLGGCHDIALHLREGCPVEFDVGEEWVRIREVRDLGLGRAQPVLNAVEGTERHQHTGIGNAEDRALLDDGVGYRLHPASKQRFLPVLAHIGDRALDQLGGPLVVLRFERMMDRLGPLAVGFVPFTSPAMECGERLGLRVGEVGAQDIGEQVVVAKPLSVGVERNQEEVLALETVEHVPAAARLVRDGVAEGRTHAAQDRCRQEEVAKIVGETREDLINEVVEDVASAAGKILDERRRVVTAFKGEHSKL